jgi:prepilin-type N-terminal cleavage/methylation domain-containing protein
MIRARGFTLIELAIVLVIITVLIGGLAMPLSAQIQARRIAETKKTLEEAREAIIGYAMSHTTSNKCTCAYDNEGKVSSSSSTCDEPYNFPDTWCAPKGEPNTTKNDIYIIRHYLPCPDTIDDGRENRDGNRCAAASGWFPWADLGTAPHDAWGNRLHYSVESREYTNKSRGLPNNPSERTPPYDGLNLKRVWMMCSDSTCTTLVADNLPVVLLSHGPNGWGARNVSGNPLAVPTSDDEKQNTNDDTDFVSRSPYKPADDSEEERQKEFDDLVVWISDGLLRSRVCPAGGCP